MCASTLSLLGVAHAGRRVNQHPAVVPSSRRCKTSSETQRRKSRAARKGKWPPRGTGTTVLTYPRSAPRGTGKAGENGRHSGEVGGSSALATSIRYRVVIVLEDGSGVAIDRVTGWSYFPPHGDGSMFSQVNVRVESVLRPPTRALPSQVSTVDRLIAETPRTVSPLKPPSL